MRAMPTASRALATRMNTCASERLGSRWAMPSAKREISPAISSAPMLTHSGWTRALSQSSLCSAWTTPRTIGKTTKEAADAIAVCRMIRSVTSPALSIHRP
jgi:hypothetical protein